MKREKGYIFFAGIKIKANCYGCKHLDYIDNASYEMQDGGYMCNERESEDYTAQKRHEENLQREKYRFRSKMCCEIKY